MRAGTKLALYAAGLLVAFGAAYGLGGLLVPQTIVDAWVDGAEHQ